MHKFLFLSRRTKVPSPSKSHNHLNSSLPLLPPLPLFPSPHLTTSTLTRPRRLNFPMWTRWLTLLNKHLINSPFTRAWRPPVSINLTNMNQTHVIHCSLLIYTDSILSYRISIGTFLRIPGFFEQGSSSNYKQSFSLNTRGPSHQHNCYVAQSIRKKDGQGEGHKQSIVTRKL